MGLLTTTVKHGFGKNLKTLPLPDIELILKYISIEILLVTISTGFGRCSFILYLLHILDGVKSYRITLWTVMLFQLACNIVSAVLPLSLCRDARILWNPTIKTTCGDEASAIKFSYFSSCEFPSLDTRITIIGYGYHADSDISSCQYCHRFLFDCLRRSGLLETKPQSKSQADYYLLIESWITVCIPHPLSFLTWPLLLTHML